MNPLPCRICDTPLTRTFVDLGMTPLSNAFLKAENLGQMEPFYPLHALACDKCGLVQLGKFQSPDAIFSQYVYFSSYSESWLEHGKRFAASVSSLLNLGPQSRVVEIASNDGYLLRHFKAKGIPVLGVEPAQNVAAEAEKSGIPTLVRFFGMETATALRDQGSQGDLIIANNVLAHVPDLHDFVGGLPLILKPEGVITLEFPHLLNLIAENQFDTIYHEHFSYFSFLTADSLFRHHGMALFDVEKLPTHGGSLRLYACHSNSRRAKRSVRVEELITEEKTAGLDRMGESDGFSEQVKETKRALLEFLIEAKREGKRVAAYGAAAKGNTLLNYCGIRSDFIDYVVDRNPHKQGCFLPGTHIPVYAPEEIRETRPDYLLILPWNIRDEVMSQMDFIRDWDGKFVIPIPELTVIS